MSPSPHRLLRLVAVALLLATCGRAQQPPPPPPAPTDVPTTPQAIPDNGPWAAFQRRLETERAVLDGQHRAMTARIDDLAQRLRAVPAGGDEADALDREIAEAADEARSRAGDALDALRAPSAVAAVLGDAAARPPLQEIRQATSDEATLRWRRVEIWGDAVAKLTGLRRRSKAEISELRRRELFGFSRVGLEQLVRETASVRIAGRLYLAQRRHSLGEIPKLARDVFTVGSALKHLLLSLLVVGGALWARRRWRRWLEVARRSAFRSLSAISWKRRLQRLLAAAQLAAPWTLFLITVQALRWAAGPAAHSTEGNVLVVLLTIYGGYRLLIDVVTSMLLGVAEHYRLAVPSERRSMLLASVREVARVAVLLLLVLLVSRTMGQGILSALVMRFAWLAVLAAVLFELMRWRHVMVSTFLELQPSGRLAAAVRAARSRWYGPLVAPASFVWLAGRGGAAVVRDFALSYEQTQRALAYLFRRRAERQAERQGYAEGEIRELPAAVVEAFQEDAVESGPLVVQRFPGLGSLHEILTGWRDTGARGSFLITGERGIGKTSWLNQVRRDDLEIAGPLALGRRVTDGRELVRRLGELLEVDPGREASAESLARALAGGPRRVVVLDTAQHLFRTTVGGYAAFETFAELINRSCRHVFWLCSMSAYAWRHIAGVRPDAAVFRTEQRLPPWSEDEIRDLIRSRCAASGAHFDYGDLVVDGMEGVSTSARLIESEEGYTRLLWDYSDGNPRAALHFFLRSLDTGRGDRLRVRLFKAPVVERLEDGGQDGLFVLAALVVHESISLEDLIAVTRLGRSQCFIHLDRLLELGAATAEDDMYRVSTAWHRAAVRLLKRRNLLPG